MTDKQYRNMFTTDRDGEIELEGIDVSELAEQIMADHKIDYAEALCLASAQLEGKSDIRRYEYLVGEAKEENDTQDPQVCSYDERFDSYDERFDLDYAGYDDPIYPKIAYVIAEHFDYDDTEIIILIDGEYHIVGDGWEEGFKLAGGLIEYAPTYQAIDDNDTFNRLREPILEKMEARRREHHDKSVTVCWKPQFLPTRKNR